MDYIILHEWKHRVSVEGKLSKWAYAKSWVPQGPVLGPILFVILVNDMPNLVRRSCKPFADDAKIYTSITTNADTSSLQGDTVYPNGYTYGTCPSMKTNAEA